MTPLSASQINELLLAASPGAGVYLVGAGGCGMSGLGHLLLDLGYQVAGSDLQLNLEIEQLRARGARIQIGHDAVSLQDFGPVLVVYSAAVRRDNPELKKARELNIPVVRRAFLLAALVHRQRGVCVAGMHGKTTTSAMLVYTLEKLGAQPSYAIGWQVPQLARHARYTSAVADAPAPHFVIETDESDGTLREFHPQDAILLNVDAEHLDHFADLDAICREFGQFVAQVSGKVIFCADDARLAELFAHNARAISYGFHPLAMYRVEIKTAPADAPGGVTAFEIWHDRRKLGDFALRLLGEKNVSNAAAVIAFLHEQGFAAEKIAPILRDFTGAARRQQELFHDERFRVFDDYGHHPTEIRATLQAIRQLRPRRLLVAFQPHRFTRTQQLLKEFGTCFAGADRLWVGEVYAASEPEIPGINSQLLVREIQSHGQPAECVASFAALLEKVRAAMTPGDLVLFLGAGADITVAAQTLVQQLQTEKPGVTEKIFAKLVSLLSPGTVLRRNEPLAKKTTMRVGGVADCYVEAATEQDLAAVLRFCSEEQVPFFVLGRGSNLLIKDGGIRGVVISLTHPNFSRVEASGDRLVCGAGAPLKQVANEARRLQLAGLEFLEGIPGSVGGALRMNAGALGGWIFDTVESVRLMDYAGHIFERKVAEMYVEYRGCPLLKNHLALGAVLKGSPAPRAQIEERMRESNEKRWRSQPRKPSAGCIFKNPSVIPAGKLIDELGLKGTRVGDAVVSDVHANFIVNDGNATAQDVLNLIEVIRQRAKSARGIDLQTEVEIVGE
jgi:UDP-N-acetylmuramate--L-alanine ligase/UDP-N-acetylenolpyruvoylglucosamine reductase